MFGSQVLEVTIGLVLVFLLVSLILSAVLETIETYFKTRAVDLERAIAELLDDRRGPQNGKNPNEEDGIRSKLYKHPLIAGLYSGTYEPTFFYEDTGKPVVNKSRWGLWDLLSWVFPVRVKGSKRKPSYIPRRQFALALLDLARSEQLGGAAAKAILTFRPPLVDQQDVASSWNKLNGQRTPLDSNAQEELKKLTANVVRNTTGEDFNNLRTAIENWYDGAMNRASGWYRRRTQIILLFLGLFVAFVLNINAVTIGRALATDDTLRAAMMTLAERTASNPDLLLPLNRNRDVAADEGAPTDITTENAGEADTISGNTPTNATTEGTESNEEAENSRFAPTEDLAAGEAASPQDIGDSEAESAAATDSEISTNDDEANSRSEDDLDAWAQTRQLHGDFLDVSLPIGWKETTAIPQLKHWQDWQTWLDLLLWLSGFLITAFAATLGAPFWFDVLNKVIVIRSTVKPNEKSGDEGSEDRKPQLPATATS